MPNGSSAEYIRALDDATERVKRLETALVELAQDSPQAPLIGALQCLRGVASVTAITIAVEIGAFTHFSSAKQLMDYVGVVPAEYSSGGRQPRGSLTKIGNAHARWLLVEAAWYYRSTLRIGAVLKLRQANQPPEIIRIANSPHLGDAGWGLFDAYSRRAFPRRSCGTCMRLGARCSRRQRGRPPY